MFWCKMWKPRKRGASHEDAADKLAVVKCELAPTISNSPDPRVADLVLVRPGSFLITTSGKASRAASIEQYRQNRFARLAQTLNHQHGRNSAQRGT
jgi:hypothetical protein